MGITTFIPTSTSPALFSVGVVPSTSNYALASVGTVTVVNATTVVAFAVNGVALWQIQPVPGGGGAAGLYLGSGITPSATNYTIQATATGTVVNAPDGGGIVLASADTAIWIAAQVPGTGGTTSGLYADVAPSATNFVLSYNSATATVLNSTGVISFANANSLMWTAQAVPSAPSLFGLFPGNVNSSATNFALASDGNSTSLNAPNASGTGLVTLGIGGAPEVFTVGSAGLLLNSISYSLSGVGPTITVTAAQARLAPLIYLTGALAPAAGVIMTFPAAAGTYVIDMSTASLGAGSSITFTNTNGNTATKVITPAVRALSSIVVINVTPTSIAAL